MEFPSLDFVEALRKALNNNDEFFTASKWSDVKVLLCFGEQRYWLKLYGGKVIDSMEYLPLANPLGWDYMIGGALDAWEELRASGDGSKAGAALLNCGRITVDGDMLQANRMYESTNIILNMVRDLK
jgi:hypothetical protein